MIVSLCGFQKKKNKKCVKKNKEHGEGTLVIKIYANYDGERCMLTEHKKKKTKKKKIQLRRLRELEFSILRMKSYKQCEKDSKDMG